MPRPVAPVVALPIALVVAACGFAIAQPGGGMPSVPNIPRIPGQPGGGGGQPGGPGGNFDPQQFIDRLMSGDANGDGKLARSEVPPQFAERNFDRFDANTDGFIDRAELEAGSANLRGPGGGGGGGRLPLGRAMNNVETAFHALEDSALNAASQAEDLRQVQALQEGFLAAKFHVPTHEFPPEGLAHFGGDAAAARGEFREHLMEALGMALELEEAVMEGDSATAKDVLERLHEHEEHSHEEFGVEE